MISRRSFLATLAALPFAGWSLVKPNRDYADVVRSDNPLGFIRFDKANAPIGGSLTLSYWVNGRQYFDTYEVKPGQISFTIPKFE